MAAIHPFYEAHRDAMEAAMRQRLDLAEAMLREHAQARALCTLEAENAPAAFARILHGARIQTSRSSSVIRIAGIALGWIGAAIAFGR
jgi:hypothetical protein